MSTSRVVATVAAAAAALVLAGSAGATAPHAIQPATVDDSTPTDSTPADPASADSATVGSLPAPIEAELVAFSQCMRDNGIADFPEPDSNGLILDDLSLDIESPLFQAAEEACFSLLPEPESDEPSEATPPSAGDSEWQKVVPGGDCACSDGSEFNFWVREADPDKVVFYLQDGGACFSAETCAQDSDVYDMTIDENDDHPTMEGGIFDFADERNPFADYSVVYVPYCTGDVHIGDATTEYAPGLTIEHKGYVNGTAALDHLAATFPGATEVAVIGGSAGSVAAPLYGGLVSDRFPDARVTVLADGSGSYPDAARLNEIIAAWGFGDVVPSWPESAGLSADQWSLPGLFIQSGQHDPDIVFARVDHAYDDRQEMWYPITGIPMEDLLSLIDANEMLIEAAGVNLFSYVAPGDEHTVLTDEMFYTEAVNGERLVDWVTRLVEGQPVDDVHCEQCTSG